MTIYFSRLVIAPLFCVVLVSCQTDKRQQFPNIIYILADDLGYGDISVYNPEGKIQTANIDRLATEGMMFTDAHTSSAVCSPTRYGILTGRYNWRTWMKQGVLWSWDQPLIDKDRTTVASMLKDHGYITGNIGKWHLGLGWQKDTTGGVDVTKKLSENPNDNGFDYFFGITASLDIPPYFYIENDRITTTEFDTIPANEGKGFWREGQIGDDFRHHEVLPVLTGKAIDFINKSSVEKRPFFLYFPLPAPHTPILPSDEFMGKSGTNEYGDFVMMVDDVVGQIMEALGQNGITENTLIIFTSDNGCSPMADFDELATFGHYPSGIYRGHKADIYEGGHRVPFVARWPDVISPGSISEEVICTTDLMATCAEIVNYTLQENEGEDSYSFMPILRDEEFDNNLREATVHHSINGSFAIRQDHWKLIMDAGSGGWSYPTAKQVAEIDTLPGIQLYNLNTDPSETTNLHAENFEKAEMLKALLTQYIMEGRSTKGVPQKNDETKEWMQLWWLED